MEVLFKNYFEQVIKKDGWKVAMALKSEIEKLCPNEDVLYLKLSREEAAFFHRKAKTDSLLQHPIPKAEAFEHIENLY
jgi:hypothetical protein